jgi:hypothetical protein
MRKKESKIHVALGDDIDTSGGGDGGGGGKELH